MWLARFTGAEILETEVPLLGRAAKLRTRIGARRLPGGNRRDAREWMSRASGETLLRQVGQWFAARGLHEGSDDVLIISAGSSAAPYNIALGYIWRIACATVMTPSLIGTEPFDFAIVPEHDFPRRKTNILATLGSPNLIDKAELKEEAEKFLAEYPPASAIRWSILLGGDDANYIIDAEWVKSEMGLIFKEAEKEGADLYITTSRRTSQSAEAALAALVERSDRVRYVLYASRDSFNPIPAMLGFSEEVFCTEDSVNMVSETVTGGHTAVLVRTRYRQGVRRLLQTAMAAMADAGALPQSCVWGVPKFDELYDRLARRGVLIEFDDWIDGRRKALSLTRDDGLENTEFNEAKRAAEWICANWRKI